MIKSLVNMVNTTMPYAWDDSLTTYEFIGKLTGKINELIKVLDEELEGIITAQVTEELKDFTTEQLMVLMQTGDLAQMIYDHIDSTVSTRLNTLDTTVAGHGTTISNHTTALATAQTDIDVLQTDVNELKSKNPFKIFYNSDGAVTKALNTALTYKGTNTLVYGNGHTLFDDAAPVNGKYELDCSSFIQAVLEGISYQNSKYFNSKNFKDTTGYYFSPSEFTYSRMLANDLAEHAYKNGYLFYPLPDYSNVHPGDLIFMRNSVDVGFFMEVGHVMLVERVDQNGNITVIDANTRTDVVAEVRYSISMLQSNNATVCARYPLPDVAIPMQTINTGAETTTNAVKASTGSVIRTISTIRDIKPNKVYTLIMKIAFTGDPLAYPLINLNGTVYTWAGDVEHRSDGLFVATFHAPSVPEANKRSFTVLGAGEWTEANVSMAILLEGAVSHWSGYVEQLV